MYKTKKAYRLYDKYQHRYLTDEELLRICINANGRVCIMGQRDSVLPESKFVFERRLDEQYENDIAIMPEYGSDTRHLVEIWQGCMHEPGPLVGFIGSTCYRNGLRDDTEDHYTDEGEPGGQVIGNLMENPELLLGYDQDESKFQWECPACSKIIKVKYEEDAIKLCRQHVHECARLASRLNSSGALARG